MSVDRTPGSAGAIGQKSPNIAIWGSYNGTSVGDTLILLGLLSSIDRVLGDSCRVTFLSMGLSGSVLERELARLKGSRFPRIVTRDVRRRHFLPRVLIALARIVQPISAKLAIHMLSAGSRKSLDDKAVLDALADSDMLLVGGGNLVMDMYPAWPHFVQLVTEQAARCDCPVLFFGVGAGPLETASGRRVFSAALRRARISVFRDHSSLELAQDRLDLPEGKGDSGPDAALGVHYQSARAEDIPGSPVVGVNIAGVFGKGWPYTNDSLRANYVQSYSELVRAMCEKYGAARVFFLTTNITDRPSEIEIQRVLAVEMPDLEFKSVHLDDQSPTAILEMASQCQLVLATRLHAALASLIAGTQVIAVSYQPKVSDVLTSAALSSTILPITVLTEGITPEQARTIVDSAASADQTPRIAELREALDGKLAKWTTVSG